MPTIPGNTIAEATTPQQTLVKVAGLITELGTDDPQTLEPAAPAEVPAVESAPPEPPAPQTSDTAELPEDDTRYTIPVDGDPTDVSLGELKKSYSFQAHNTRKAQELADREQRLEPEIRQRVESELMQERQEYQQGLAQIRQALQQLQGEPDWLQLRSQVGDAEFLKQKADWEASKAQRERLAQEEHRVADLNLAAQQKQFASYLRAEEDKLRTAVPEWSDVEKGKAEIAKIATFVRQTYQIPDAQVANAFQTAAAILLARDAMRYRELHREPNAQAKAKTAAIKPARPGTPDRPRPNAKFEQLVEKTKSGRQRDAMAAILAGLPDD